MSFAAKTTPESLRTIDSNTMHEQIASMGNHLLDARSRAMHGLQHLNARTPASIILAGVGGSAIGGDLVRSYLFDGLQVPLVINRGYRLPSFASKDSLVIASSYSGNTEETLAQLEEAARKGIPVVSFTTGGELGKRSSQVQATVELPPGFQPRVALGYSFIPVLTLLEKIGLAEDQSMAIERTAVLLQQLAERYGTSDMTEQNIAYNLGMSLLHHVPVIYTSGEVFDSVGLRWRGQMQENAKHVAFGNMLPEMNHNEISGWAHPADAIKYFNAIFLRSQQDEHPRITKRFEIVKELLQSKSVSVTEFKAEGETRLERMFSLISLGDWTSFYLAIIAGVDPTPIPAIDQLKNKLQ